MENQEKCERCERKLDQTTKMQDNSAVPVRYGQTDMVVCYPCAQELTLIIGAWLGTEPMDDPVKWFRSTELGAELTEWAADESNLIFDDNGSRCAFCGLIEPKGNTFLKGWDHWEDCFHEQAKKLVER